MSADIGVRIVRYDARLVVHKITLRNNPWSERIEGLVCLKAHAVVEEADDDPLRGVPGRMHRGNILQADLSKRGAVIECSRTGWLPEVGRRGICLHGLHAAPAAVFLHDIDLADEGECFEKGDAGRGGINADPVEPLRRLADTRDNGGDPGDVRRAHREIRLVHKPVGGEDTGPSMERA